MGTERLEKVLIATHQEERDELLRRLQEEGLIHIVETRSDKKGGKDESQETTEDVDPDLKSRLAKLTQAAGFLADYAEKRKQGLFSQKPSMPANDFRRRVVELDLPVKLEKISGLTEESSLLDNEERKIEGELELLSPWKKLAYSPSRYTDSRRTDARFVFISSEEEGKALREGLADCCCEVECVKKENATEYAVLMFPRAQTEEVEDVIKTCGVKMLQLAKFSREPVKEITVREDRLRTIAGEKERINEEAKEMAAELSGLETAMDLYENETLINEQYPKMAETEKAVFISGWVRVSQRKRLNKIVSTFPASEIRGIKPHKDEEVPVALKNEGPFKSFELITNMYSMPDGREADPTPFMAPFFALFFALCLTDAGYGIVISLLTAYLIWIRKMKTPLLGILFYGGLLTIITGAATGSWFGNMPDFLQMPWLIDFRNAVLWFDPLKDPMPFFYLSLGVGYFQMMFGIGIAVVDGLRTRQYGKALFESLPWFLIFLAAPFLAGVAMGVLPETLKGIPVVAGIIIIITSLGAVIVLSERPGPTPVTAAILIWTSVTAALLALAKGIGLLPVSGIVIKGILVGIVVVLWLYTIYKGVTEKRLKIAGIIIGVLGLVSVALHLSGMLGAFKQVPFFSGNALLAIMFVLNFVFALMVLKGWGGRIIWGAYNVYSNTTGVLGIVLSYVRLMALGMVTAGIAMAFNEIAWMLGGIPVVSVILILVVLIIGHVYNLLMSALSGFVHTLRLQYVEFLPQFFSGGGKPFEPFELKTRFVKVTRRP
ncbi:hypothetical protein GF359_09375 [candidate division WOR-3 bacterium]|uniref:V-type ATP synthase subunit I n=1 Tax=candidate division WOR-3 bacterium TaxID=2052148 RepID=A0A9D5KAZ6_UNCW3|nr:hypothetical protein [candidate division WOR-3 bacterium]MBD3365409.1 hypothetical protein [candidate division WOR-3 bacterium]